MNTDIVVIIILIETYKIERPIITHIDELNACKYAYTVEPEGYSTRAHAPSIVRK